MDQDAKQAVAMAHALETIATTLDELKGDRKALTKAVTEIATKVQGMEAALQKHDRALYGNGRPGLVAEVASRPSGSSSESGFSSERKVWAGIITAIIGGIVAIATSLINRG